MVRVNRPVQRIVIAVLAILLVVPLGAVGITSLMNPDADEQETAQDQGQEQPTDDRPTVDPAQQPPRPEVAKPEAPAGLTEQTPEGAQATVTYLLDSYTYMMTSGDVSVWENSVDPKCEVCTTFLGNAELLAEQDGYLVDGGFDVSDTAFEGKGEPPATGEVTATFTQAASIIVDDPRYEATPIDEVSGQIVAQVAWDGDRWRVTDMSLATADGAGDGTGDEAGAGDGAADGSGAGAGG